jgi:hypothetical protein
MSDASVPESDSVLASVQAEAQVEASRFFGDTPVQAWSPPNPWVPALARGARVLGLIAAVCCVLAAVIGGVAWSFLREAPPEPPSVDELVTDAADDALDDRVDDVVDDVVDDFANEPASVAAPLRHTAAQDTAATSPLLNITRQGAEWRIEAVGVSRMQVAQRLSQVSGSPLSGDVAALAATRPVRLSWHGRNTAGAWQAVLGHEVSFATQCSTRRCRVWIAGAGTADAGPAPPRALPVIAPPPMPAAMELAAAPPQSDSADPRVAAHHD